MRKTRGYRFILGLIILTLSTLHLTGCSQPSEKVQASSSPAALMDEDAAKAKAKESFQKLGGALKERLQAAMKDGGPTAAVEVCHQEAPELASEISEELGYKMGRSSHRLRSPRNRPSAAIKEYLMKHADTPAAEVPVEANLDGEVWTVIAPIATQPLCLTCHGEAESMDPKLYSVLKEKYPEDNAVGFKAGDLRGVFWAEIPQSL